jgi:haloalkane dehalogenase
MNKTTKTVLAAGAAVGTGLLIKSQLSDHPTPIGSYGGTDVYRTPETQFANLVNYPFAPHYLDINGLRMHYVDEGAGDVVLMLHGEPSWSYLYRKMIPLFVAAGYRAVAPDLIGFGKSDKLAEKNAYSYQTHVDWMWEFVQSAELNNITVVCQDWGSLIGLRLVAGHPERFARVIVANGMLPTGDHGSNAAFQAWLTFSQTTPIFPVGKVIQMGTVTKLSQEVIAAYNAPFPSEAYKAAARVFPKLVPVSADDPATIPNRTAWELLKTFDKPFLTAFGDKDPIMRGSERIFQKLVPGTKGQPHTILADAGHFIQEDKGEELAQLSIDFMAANPL